MVSIERVCQLTLGRVVSHMQRPSQWMNKGIVRGNITPPFYGSSIGSAHHGADWETVTVGDTKESLNKNAVISEIKSF